VLAKPLDAQRFASVVGVALQAGLARPAPDGDMQAARENCNVWRRVPRLACPAVLSAALLASRAPAGTMRSMVGWSWHPIPPIPLRRTLQFSWQAARRCCQGGHRR
jgi:hypothetical protein